MKIKLLDGTEKEFDTLVGADLSWANLFGADLSRANLSGANLSVATLSWANLSEANLSKADLSVADLFRANLYKADLSGANLSGADLSGANLFNTNGVIGLFLEKYWVQAWIKGSETIVKIGCEEHTLEDWKRHGLAIARKEKLSKPLIKTLKDCLKMIESWSKI